MPRIPSELDSIIGMNLEKLDLSALTQLVEDVAALEIMPRFQCVVAGRKPDGSVITEADLAVQRILSDQLGTRFPAIALLGEEMSVAEQTALLADNKQWLWCLDPLDGTGNFAAGIPLFSVSLALLHDGRPVVGVVHDPNSHETFSAVAGKGAWINGELLQAAGSVPADLSGASALVDFKRLPRSLAVSLATQPPYRSQRSFGSVALDWCWLAMGRCHVYLHGGQQLWDYAAGALILSEAGGVGGLYERYDGQAQDRISLTPRIGLAATSAELFAAWRAWLLGAQAQ